MALNVGSFLANGAAVARTGEQHPVTLADGGQESIVTSLGAALDAGGGGFGLRSWTGSYDIHFDNTSRALLDDGPFHCQPGIAFRSGMIQSEVVNGSGDIIGRRLTTSVEVGSESLLVDISTTARGTAFEESAIELAVVVTNQGVAPVSIGGRWAWIAGIRGYLNIAWSGCDPCMAEPWWNQEEEYFAPADDHLLLADNNTPSVTPSAYFAGLSCNGPWTLSPPPTPPDRIAFGFDPTSLDPAERAGPFSTCFEWHPRTPRPYRPRTMDRGPEAMGYWWGDTPASAIPLAPGESVRFTVWEWAFITNPVHCDAGPPLTVECDGVSTSVQLDQSASFTDGGSALLYRWSCADPRVTFDDPRSMTPVATFPGVGHYELKAECGVGPYTDAFTKIVDVVDTTAPALAAPSPQSLLTSALGECVARIAPGATATDACSTPTITHVTLPDVGTGGAVAAHDYPLGTTRITFTATDSSSNATSAETTVTLVDDVPPALAPPAPLVVRTSAAGACLAHERMTATASDDCGSVTVTHVTLPDVGTGGPTAEHDFPLGTTRITYTATDGSSNATSAETTVTLIDDVPPVLSVPPAATYLTSALHACSVRASVASSASDDCAVASLTHVTIPDIGGGGALAEHDYPLGTTRIVFTATDSSGNATTSETSVTVRDDVAPRFDRLTASPSTLWPPNHAMREVAIDASVSDDCDASPRVALVSASSSEPADGRGDGHAQPDVAGAVTGTDDRSVSLRAERDGRGTGRTYALAYRVTDASGNASDAVATVRVEHDQR